MKIGYGGGAIADYPWHYNGVPWTEDDDERVMTCLESLDEFGIRMIDTAHRYGKGKSESLIGDFIRRYPERDHCIVTKIPLGTIAEMEASLSESEMRLGKIHCLLLHDPDLSKEWVLSDASDWLMNILETGTVEKVGFSTEPVREVRRYYKDFGLNAIQFPYSSTDRRAEDHIFPWIMEGIFSMTNRVLGGPIYDGGIISVKSEDEVLNRIAFIKGNGAKINTVLIGTKNAGHLRQIAGMLSAREHA